MNKIKYVFLFIFFALLITPVYAEELYVNEINNYKVIYEDDAKLLSEDEKEKLKEVMIPLTEYGNILFKTINDNSYTPQNKVVTYQNMTYILALDDYALALIGGVKNGL